ncbi:mediator of RNA polymerase II transcription subunit 24 isoform X2 [Vulpes vulpes]|uniref:Mediator of RNA polymerase II transcription subunit 24 n=4 Tax=Canidae TaxID=9608 RepID=A0A8P0T2C4_CANLF|nr:mediator of RNA polymerase II transcription subunit 24 isoform X2 [Canis lupus familiaris]XP_025296209.1 mediator of RNA polymerase II transcription subunit 24 isoform X2 [Canis lupus dingo]XP_025851531.1 mediator of RNA polymerase II transcription subunit 24 isoform X2 [Vulpes vulpes]XP_038403330.1 mediator of RNA polymerase II transcription subunit 24 isoform X2 [Canis lupus familiaris]XP_038532507.1 mediator of RNA polymerase II transcription subunit 24 isoform X2 [Canis lupus familiaris]|eukprot:XP_005624599.1 mediator of RNA polymerase II transcription subunit 24 isoform X2 [Canis lupus familiaris]
MKVVNLKQAILQAWKERWSDYQWAINMKKFFPKGATWDILNLAEALLEQAMIGPSPNPLILSYLKYAISSQMVSYSSVLTAISKFDDFSRDLCVQALLDIMDMFCDRLSCHGKAEECIGLCRALLSALHWLLRCTAASAERLREGLEAGTPAAGEKQLAMCLLRLEKTLSSTKNRALLHIAKLEEASSWTAIEHSLLKLGEILASLSNPQLRSQAEQCGTLIRSIPTMLAVHSEQLHKTGYPTVHAVVLLEGTMNLTGETQPLVEQLMMVKRMQHIPTPLFVLEIWKACFVGLIESPEGTEELKWTAFTFLKIPQVLVKLKKYCHGDKDFTEDVSCAFEFLLKLTPLLDKADQRCNCDCTKFLLQECSKQGLLSEASVTNLLAKRAADREHAPQLKSGENANIQPNPGLILRAEPTVTNILKTMDADHSKSPEGLLGVLGHMLSGKSLDLLLAAAAATGKLKSFARKFINLNEFTTHGNEELAKAASVRALLFDISFLMLCHVAQTYGSEVILSESSTGAQVPFFETWMQTCMPEEGKILNPDHPCFWPDSTKVESLVALLNNSSEMKLVQMKWHEACLSISAAILEILNAWENGVLAFESIQKITDNIKGKVCSLAVCAVAWLVAHVRMLGLDEREKSLQMIRQLAGPLYSENTLQFYNERVVIMSSILEHMCADVLQQTATQIKFPSTGVDTMPYWNLLPPKRPIKEVLTDIFAKVLEKGWVDSRSIHIFDTLLHMGGVYWFCNNLIKELLKETRKEHTLRAVELLYSIFCLDMQQVTLVLLGHILPGLLTDSSKWHSLMDPPGTALAKLAVWCALSSYSSHKGQASSRQKKRHREDIEDYVSLFPLDDMQPSKLMRLLSSNEEDANILSSPTDRSMSSSLSASQLHTVNMRDPLNRVLANLFLLISSILGSRTAGPHTQFVQWFMEECVDCLEQGSRGSILQFMPFTTVSELVKVSAMSSPKVVLAITDLSLSLGRQVAAKAIAAL